VPRWIVVIVVLAVLGGGLVWMTRSRRPESLPAVAPEAAKTPPLPTPAPPTPVAAPPAPAPSVSDAPNPADAPNAAGAPLPADPAREAIVRRQLTAVLDRYPGVATVTKLECLRTGACNVEMEVRDLKDFGAPLERLQEPESGLSGDHAIMVLSKPEAVGPGGTPPYRFKFYVTPPEGGGAR
jgi:hypothetical protein